MLTTDELWMTTAIRRAQAAVREGERPFGCLIVVDLTQELIGIAGGTHSILDATRHSEIVAIQQACEVLGPGEEDLWGCTLYSTHEPCPMCCGAINHAKVGRVVWGSARADLPDLFRQTNLRVEDRLADTSHPPEQIPGVLREQCIALFDPDRQDTLECQWFAGCHEPAVELVPHPVLPDVPTCAKHVAWIKGNS